MFGRHVIELDTDAPVDDVLNENVGDKFRLPAETEHDIDAATFRQWLRIHLLQHRAIHRKIENPARNTASRGLQVIDACGCITGFLPAIVVQFAHVFNQLDNVAES